VIALCVALACGGDGPTAPSRSALVTFQVADETFRVQLVGERQIDRSPFRRIDDGNHDLSAPDRSFVRQLSRTCNARCV
jgi:hypothetical protein